MAELTIVVEHPAQVEKLKHKVINCCARWSARVSPLGQPVMAERKCPFTCGTFYFCLGTTLVVFFRLGFGIKTIILLKSYHSADGHSCKSLASALSLSTFSSFFTFFCFLFTMCLIGSEQNRNHLGDGLREFITETFPFVPCWNAFSQLLDAVALFFMGITYLVWTSDSWSSKCPELFPWFTIACMYHLVYTIASCISCYVAAISTDVINN